MGRRQPSENGLWGAWGLWERGAGVKQPAGWEAGGPGRPTGKSSSQPQETNSGHWCGSQFTFPKEAALEDYCEADFRAGGTRGQSSGLVASDPGPSNTVTPGQPPAPCLLGFPLDPLLGPLGRCDEWISEVKFVPLK